MRIVSRPAVCSLGLLLLWWIAAVPSDGAATQDVKGPPLSGVGLLSRFAQEQGLAPAVSTQIAPGPTGNSPSGPAAEPQGVVPEIKVNQDYSNAPQNETTIAVNPASPNMLIAGANDYRLGVPIGAAFYTSFNSGGSWTDGFPPFPLLAGAAENHNASADESGATGEEGDPDFPAVGGGQQLVEPPFGTGDPVVAFGEARPGSSDLDAGTPVAYYAYLGVSASFCEHGIFVSRSTNGLTWTRPSVPPLLPPRGLFTPVYWEHDKDCSVFNDKPWMTVDRSGGPHNGRVYVVYTRFVYNEGKFRSSTIEMTYSDDNAETWSAPIGVSGVSSELCPAQVSARSGRCDESQFATAVVGPNGTLHVAFINQQSKGAEDGFRNQYLVTSVNPDTLELSGPYRAATMIDGKFDFPVNSTGGATLCNSNFRLNTAGNLTIDPSDPTGKTLYIVFSDNRNGSSFPSRPEVTQDPADTFDCPDGSMTDNDIFIVRTTDGGERWGSPVRVNQDPPQNDKDQWFPFAAVGPDGTISVVYDDRRDDFFNHVANVYVSRSSDHGVTWTDKRVTTVSSDINLAFGNGVFMGDYNSIAVGPNGTSYPIWTDSRNATQQMRHSDVYIGIVPP